MAKPLYLAVWRDAKDADSTWVTKRDAEQFADDEVIVESYGYLVSKTSKYVTLAGDWCDSDSTYGRVCKIPVGFLISLEQVHEASAAHPSPPPGS